MTPSDKIVETPKATNFNYQPRVHTNLRGDNAICIVSQSLLMSPSINELNQGIKRPLLLLDFKENLHIKARVYPNYKKVNIILVAEMRVSFIKCKD